MLDLMKFGTIFKNVLLALKDSKNIERRNEAMGILRLLYIYSEDSVQAFVQNLKDLNGALIAKISESLSQESKIKTGISIFAHSSFNPEESKLEETPI